MSDAKGSVHNGEESSSLGVSWSAGSGVVAAVAEGVGSVTSSFLIVADCFNGVNVSM